MSSDHALPSGAPPGLSLLKILAAGLFAAGIALLIGDKSAKILLLAPLVFIGLAASIRYPLVALAGLTVMIVTNMSQNLIVSFDLPSIAKLAAPGLFTLLAARWFIYRDVPYIGWLATACLVALFALKLLSATYAAHWETSLKLSMTTNTRSGAKSSRKMVQSTGRYLSGSDHGRMSNSALKSAQISGPTWAVAAS